MYTIDWNNIDLMYKTSHLGGPWTQIFIEMLSFLQNNK